MKLCSKCGAENDTGNGFCSKCGAPFGSASLRRPVYKKWWFWVVIVVAIMVVIPKGSGSKRATPAGTQATIKPSAIVTKAPDTTISLAEFNSLNTGMSYKEAVSIIGCEGTISSQSKMNGIETIMYTWKGSGDLGANANAMFQNNNLVSKAQAGLK